MTSESSRTHSQAPHPLLTGIAAGLIGGLAAGLSDKILDRLVSDEQKQQDRQVREGPSHEIAGPYFARRLTGKTLSSEEKKQAQSIFNLAYGIGWGMIHAGIRKEFPGVARFGGLPFAIPFFFACDGTLAPLLGVSPSLRHIPWQMNAKEMGNHIAWTVAAEMVHRAVARAAE